MEENSGGLTKKLIWIILGFAVLVALILLSSRTASSYYFTKGIESFYGGDYAGAEKNLSRSITFNPFSPLPHSALGRLALGKETPGEKEYYPNADWAKSIPRYERALELGLEKNTGTGFYPHTLEHLGHAYFNTGQYEKAREMFLKKIERFPLSFYGELHTSTFWPRLLTAEMDFERFNKPEEARDLLLPLTEPENSDPQNIYRVYILLSRLYSYFGDMENVEKYAKLALAEHKDSDGTEKMNTQIAYSMLATIARQRGDFTGAAMAIEKSKQAGAPDEINCVLANSYFRVRDFSRAISSATSVKEPANSSYLYSSCIIFTAKAQKALGKDADARKSFQGYLDYAEKLAGRNIFTLRFMEEARKELGR